EEGRAARDWAKEERSATVRFSVTTSRASQSRQFDAWHVGEE
ncbi:hypothetical protein Goarm_010148, partial [Gossypium armourianum]|nr:hypothetical protein [Gossypium armourianum]